MKSGRHAKILEIISNSAVETQDELLERLGEEGYRVTQATVSRDIKDLRLVKTLGGDGKYRYTAAQNNSADIRSTFSQLFSSSVLSSDRAQNIVVIKTLPGLASGAAGTLDSMNVPDLVGTLAGDDTVFLVMKSNSAADALCEEIQKML